MVTLAKSGNAIVFTFDDNDHYLNDGTIEVPVNSLTLVTDESQMATFKKSATNDIFISATYNELGMSKADLESWFKENACGATGGGSGSGVTSGEVQTMIDDSISGKADTSAVTASITAAVSGKQDTLVSGTNIKTINNESILGSGNIDIQGGSSINVVQTTGTSTGDVMSQSAVTNELNNKTTKSDAIKGYSFGETSGKAFVKFQKANNSYLSELYFSKINNKEVWGITNINACKNWELVETSAITSSVTSSSTDSQVPSAKAVYDALQEGGGGLPESAFTTYTAATEVRLAEDEEVTAAALNSLNDATAANTTALGGLKLVQLTQVQYDNLATKDANTLYLIV